MPDSILSSKLRMGVFNSSKKASKPQYRLFSVVEHIGYYAHRGHYVSHTMDSQDLWKCFDDEKVLHLSLIHISEPTRPY